MGSKDEDPEASTISRTIYVVNKRPDPTRSHYHNEYVALLIFQV